MEKEYGRVESIGVALIKHKKITRDDFEFLKKYYREDSILKKLSDEELINADPRVLTSGYKAYRTFLRQGRGLSRD